MESGAENARPFQLSTSPLLSTSTQRDTEVQDTELSWPWVSALSGCVQVCPSHSEGPPSAATQKDGDTHEIWLAAPQAPRLPDQPEPSNSQGVPLAVDRHAEGGAGAVDGGDPLRSGDGRRGLPRRAVEQRHLVQVRRGGAEGRAGARQVGDALGRGRRDGGPEGGHLVEDEPVGPPGRRAEHTGVGRGARDDGQVGARGNGTALDHVPAGPAVVGVVWARVVVVGAPEVAGLPPQPATIRARATTASAAPGGPARLRTTCEPGGRSPRWPGGGTTYRAR